ncbi:hypothetical protein BJX68DRAFT_252878 [Aspergillus pseudodeflectus]|uniref:Transcription factor domain-containing protein n=1 Tax=Aspergillus pseudodeflectus TaxID=176178 RepID=A0ABR4L1E8_9EURO
MVKSRVEVLNHNSRPSSIWNRLGEIPVLSPERAHHLIESCEFDGGGSFAPGEGEAWGLFKVALDLYPRVLLLNTDIREVQAIFCLNLSGTQIEGKILSEAARVARRAFLNKASADSDATTRSRVFWVVYYIEKTVSFHTGCTSFIADCDIGSPIPFIAEAVFEDFDCTISEFEELLEQQRQAIPSRFRPGIKLRPRAFSHPCGLIAAVRAHYHYHELKIALNRLKLHVKRGQIAPGPSSDVADIMHSARSVIEITRVIQQEPSTPFFVIFFMPFTALFILFDHIIQDPSHEDIHGSLALLKSVTGYFSALEYATSGYLPGSMLMPFASIDRQFHATFRTSRGDNTSNGSSAKGTASEQCTTEMLSVEPTTDGQAPWEVSAYGDLRVQIRLTPGLGIMDLFCGPVHDPDFFFAPFR